MALVIRPVRLNKTIYVRIPNDIADLIGLQARDAMTLTYEDLQKEVRLTYTVQKSNSNEATVSNTIIQQDSSRAAQLKPVRPLGR
jgi:hypothetical protein